MLLSLLCEIFKYMAKILVKLHTVPHSMYVKIDISVLILDKHRIIEFTTILYKIILAR